MLIVQSGGRVNYINSTARRWLELHDGEQPNLEVLARRIRPSEDFLKLCTEEGQVRFSVNGRPMEAVSYHVPGLAKSLLISMRRPDLASAEVWQSQEISNSALKILTDLGKAVAASPDLSTTIQVILDNLERLIPSDVLEIKLWKDENRVLIPYRMGLRAGSENELEKGMPQAAIGYTTYLVEDRQALFIPNTQKNETDILPATTEQASFHSYIGLPLLAGEELVGTLEVGLNGGEPFNGDDLDILQLVVGQATAAIRNASMLEAEQRRSIELSGLADLAQALGSTRDAHDLFTRLVQCHHPSLRCRYSRFPGL